MTDNQTSDTPLLGAQTSGVDLNTAIMVLVVTAVLYWGWDDLLSLLGLSSDKSKSSSSSASDSRMSKSEELDENDWVYKLIEGVSGSLLRRGVRSHFQFPGPSFICC